MKHIMTRKTNIFLLYNYNVEVIKNKTVLWQFISPTL